MTWYEDAATFAEEVARYGSPTQAANVLGGISDRAARERWRVISAASSVGMDGVGVGSSATIDDHRATLTSAANPSGTGSTDPEDLLREHGLDPSEWDYRVSATSWDAMAGDGAVTTLHRIKVDAIRRPETLSKVVFASDWTPPKAVRGKKSRTRPTLIAAFPDPHFPMHEPSLIEASVAWLEDHEIEHLIFLGDVSDASPFKRHTANPRIDCSVEEHVRSTYEGLARWCAAAPNARKTLIPGNHDEWCNKRLREQFPQYMQLSRPGEDFGLLTIRSMLALDTLGIESLETDGEYHDATLQVADDLVALHGVQSGVHGAIKEQAGWESTSIISGHTHKIEMTAVTKRLPGGGETQRYAINSGTMARRDLGYSHKHDCAQGWTTFTIWPDGRWHPEFALFDPQTESTTWRDWKFTP